VRSVVADVLGVELRPASLAYVVVRIRGSNGLTIDAVYEMVWEEAGRMDAVATRPAGGLMHRKEPRERRPHHRARPVRAPLDCLVMTGSRSCQAMCENSGNAAATGSGCPDACPQAEEGMN